ncbi:MAG: exopolysaccharide biosynthesis protein [Bacteroidales bacterium]|nr:exopolysaccharide biosynthesis protein [Bacteroidales bacterium]
MLRFTVFPNYTKDKNPYIRDMITALEAHPGTRVVNPVSRHSVLSILPPSRWGKVFIFNWFESVPDFKYGIPFSLLMLLQLRVLKLCGRKIVWVFHNKMPHETGKKWLKRLMARRIARLSNLIVTHASEGLETICELYPYAAHKAHFIHHPTKNHLKPEPPAMGTRAAEVGEGVSAVMPQTSAKCYDLLIWGSITPYKGIVEFLGWLRNQAGFKPGICICGGCSSEQLQREIQALVTDNIEFIPKRLTTDDISRLTAQSHFVLSTYRPESILSSGVLMDSLSYGGKVIGPAVGSFKDYALMPELKVYTYEQFDEIPGIVAAHRADPIDRRAYGRFLDEHNWTHFVDALIELVRKS